MAGATSHRADPYLAEAPARGHDRLSGTSTICSCSAAIHIDPTGRRTDCYDGSPHLDHTAYTPWARRHGLTLDHLGWLPMVLAWPRGIRDQLVSPRLLHAVGLLPGIDWKQYGPTSGAFITTPGQQPHYSGYETVADETVSDQNDPEGALKPPVERHETPQNAPDDPDPTPTTSEGVHQPDAARRFGTEDETRTPGRTATKRWGG